MLVLSILQRDSSTHTHVLFQSLSIRGYKIPNIVPFVAMQWVLVYFYIVIFIYIYIYIYLLAPRLSVAASLF